MNPLYLLLRAQNQKLIILPKKSYFKIKLDS